MVSDTTPTRPVFPLRKVAAPASTMPPRSQAGILTTAFVLSPTPAELMPLRDALYPRAYAGEVVTALNGSGIGTFSDRTRDALRGGGPADGGEALVK